MKIKTKKFGALLACVLSLCLVMSVVLAPVDMVAYAATELWDDIDADTVFNETVIVPEGGYYSVGYNNRCVVVINGNLHLSEGWYDPVDDYYHDGTALYLFKDSLIIVNGNLSVGSGANLLSDYCGDKVIVTGSITNNGFIDDNAVQTSLQNIGYVAETDANYEYFTSGGKVYTWNGSQFVETTLAAVSKAPAASINIVKKDAYVEDGKGYMRYITELTFDPSMTVESFGTWFIPTNLLSTNNYAMVQYDGSAITSGQTYTADLLGIPGSELIRNVTGISFANFAGADTVTTSATASVNSILAGGTN